MTRLIIITMLRLEPQYLSRSSPRPLRKIVGTSTRLIRVLERRFAALPFSATIRTRTRGKIVESPTKLEIYWILDPSRRNRVFSISFHE